MITRYLPFTCNFILLLNVTEYSSSKNASIRQCGAITLFKSTPHMISFPFDIWPFLISTWEIDRAIDAAKYAYVFLGMARLPRQVYQTQIDGGKWSKFFYSTNQADIHFFYYKYKSPRGELQRSPLRLISQIHGAILLLRFGSLRLARFAYSTSL